MNGLHDMGCRYEKKLYELKKVRPVRIMNNVVQRLDPMSARVQLNE